MELAQVKQVINRQENDKENDAQETQDFLNGSQLLLFSSIPQSLLIGYVIICFNDTTLHYTINNKNTFTSTHQVPKKFALLTT